MTLSTTRRRRSPPWLTRKLKIKTLQAGEHHRDHAQVEQVLADWTDGPMAHLPSGSFPANAAWLALAAISHNLLRAAGALASLAGPRQGPRRHAAPRPDRRRRPHRPPRPRRNHPAPARRLAPPGRMEEPVRSRLPPATRTGGLTSPHPATAPPSGPPRPPVPRPRTRKITRKPPHEARGQAVIPRLTRRNSACQIEPGNDLPQFVGGSRLSIGVSVPWVARSPAVRGFNVLYQAGLSCAAYRTRCAALLALHSLCVRWTRTQL